MKRFDTSDAGHPWRRPTQQEEFDAFCEWIASSDPDFVIAIDPPVHMGGDEEKENG